MTGTPPLSIIVRIDRSVTRYECERGRHCISIVEIIDKIGALGSELGPSERGRSRSGKNLREIEVPEWWNVAPDRVSLGRREAPG